MNRNRILVSGAGIAGLTLAIALKQNGLEPVLIERDNIPRSSGPVMEFFGTGWDVMGRLGLGERLAAFPHMVEALDFVDRGGLSWLRIPMQRIRSAFRGNYRYLRRPELERILAERARELGIEIRYGTGIHALIDRGDGVHTTFIGGKVEDFALVIGADGVRSRVRMLVFGPDRRFTRPLGLCVASFPAPRNGFAATDMCQLYEERDRAAIIWPAGDERIDALYVFRSNDDPDVPQNLESTRAHYEPSGWIAAAVLREADATSFQLDGATQTIVPQWHRGRVALIGDACGSIGWAGPNAQMAMASGYVLARELARHTDHRDAFAAYQAALKPAVARKQSKAKLCAELLVPKADSHPWLRRFATKLMFSSLLLPGVSRWHGATSVLRR